MAQKNVLTTSDYLPFEEFEKLIAGLRKDKQYIWELYATLSFCTALRTSDIRNLHWKEALGKSITVIEKKTKKTRTVKLNADVQAKIRRLYNLLDQPHVSSLIFVNKRTGEPITSQYVNLKLKEFKRKYNLAIDNFSTHTFRKTFGRYVYESTQQSPKSLLLLNRILNHTSIEVTKTYIGITQDEIDDVFLNLRMP